MAGTPNQGIKRWIKAFEYTCLGLKAAYKHEEAFRQEVFAFVLAVPLSLYLGENAVQIALMLSSIVILLIVELINSAIEAVVDRFGNEKHELSGRAKDIGSAAVFLAVINAVIIWLAMIFN